MSILLWRVYGIEEPKKEFRFHEKRRWRFDFCWPDKKVAVEIEGGIWIRGAHTRGKHFLSDAEKYNMATFLGWQVYRFTPDQLRKGVAQAFIKQVFDNLRGT